MLASDGLHRISYEHALVYRVASRPAYREEKAVLVRQSIVFPCLVSLATRTCDWAGTIPSADAMDFCFTLADGLGAVCSRLGRNAALGKCGRLAVVPLLLANLVRDGSGCCLRTREYFVP